MEFLDVDCTLGTLNSGSTWAGIWMQPLALPKYKGLYPQCLEKLASIRGMCQHQLKNYITSDSK